MNTWVWQSKIDWAATQRQDGIYPVVVSDEGDFELLYSYWDGDRFQEKEVEVVLDCPPIPSIVGIEEIILSAKARLKRMLKAEGFEPLDVTKDKDEEPPKAPPVLH